MQSIEIEQIGFVELNPIQYLGYVFAFPSGKIVEPYHFFALLPAAAGPEWTR